MSPTTLWEVTKRYVEKDEKGNNIFNFEKIVPIGDVPDWHDQRLEKWGTKWVGYDLCIGESAMDFFTAWSPPLPIIRKLAELHKDLVFRLEYYELGMLFRGEITAKWQDGEVVTDEKDWNMTDEDMKELGFMPG
jgi:hypothetical protein